MGIGSFIQGRFNDKTQKVRLQMLDGKFQILPAQDVGKKRAGKDISCTAGPKGSLVLHTFPEKADCPSDWQWQYGRCPWVEHS